MNNTYSACRLQLARISSGKFPTKFCSMYLKLNRKLQIEVIKIEYWTTYNLNFIWKSERIYRSQTHFSITITIYNSHSSIDFKKLILNIITRNELPCLENLSMHNMQLPRTVILSITNQVDAPKSSPMPWTLTSVIKKRISCMMAW